MSKSENGWEVQTHQRNLRTWVIPIKGGPKRHLVIRDNRAGFLLATFALIFAELIEEPSKVWDWWGYANRNVRGSTRIKSDHASATAIDLNATQHPRGMLVTANFTDDQLKEVRRQLGRPMFRSVLRWGGGYPVPDGMHFALKTTNRLKILAAARLAAKTPRGRRVLAANPGFRAPVLRKIAGL